MSKPEIVLLISGKRKCGKDFMSSQLISRYVNICCAYICYPYKNWPKHLSEQKIQNSQIFTSSIGNDRSEIIRISAPIKSHWAHKKGLNLEELLSDGPYKEQYRKEMIVWSDSVRAKEPGYFCAASMSTCMKRPVTRPTFVDIERPPHVYPFFNVRSMLSSSQARNQL